MRLRAFISYVFAGAVTRLVEWMASTLQTNRVPPCRAAIAVRKYCAAKIAQAIHAAFVLAPSPEQEWQRDDKR
ncbi:hypothetical protein DR64_7766 [Paraburkholderia xenovorans LB400]|nr:hypothetical protein DR64_7766 [Paraburkholderia xenovorans LB400]